MVSVLVSVLYSVVSSVVGCVLYSVVDSVLYSVVGSGLYSVVDTVLYSVVVSVFCLVQEGCDLVLECFLDHDQASSFSSATEKTSPLISVTTGSKSVTGVATALLSMKAPGGMAATPASMAAVAVMKSVGTCIVVVCCGVCGRWKSSRGVIKRRPSQSCV